MREDPVMAEETRSGPADGEPIRPPRGSREVELASLTEMIAEAWRSFDRPRPQEPRLDADLERRLAGPLPEQGTDAAEVFDDAAEILDRSISPARPLYLGYIGSTGLKEGVLGAALAATYDVNLAATAGAADLVERQALEWVAEFIGYPSPHGSFTSGGMTSNLNAVLAAREHALPGSRFEGLAGRRGAAYCSEEAHHSVVRAFEAAGLGSNQVRRIPIDERRRLRPELLEQAIADDVAAGIVPIAVVANGGTTLTGAVDPLEATADVCERHGVWLHVDGAYGLPAAATESAGHLFAGVERADSVTLDAHKWLGVPKSCSIVLVRDRATLEAAFGHEESYLRRSEVDNAVERTLEYSRPFRSLRLWVALRTHGAAAFRVWIEHTLALARLLAEQVRADPCFELVCEPTLSTVCMRHLPDGVADLDSHNDRLARETQTDGRVFVAPAVVDGRTCQRVCFVNFRTQPEDVDLVLETLRDLGAKLGDSSP
jgi:aromatic-L-amino-acid decarboxylase